MAKESREEFLRKIMQIESSGGTDTEHRRMTAGLHKGEAAMGKFGIMPKTAAEFINRRRLEGRFGPDDAIMSQLSPEELKQFLASNERVETNLAKDIADKVLTRSDEDEEKAAYMWNMGHNTPPSRITDEKLTESPYVRKFRKLENLLSGRKKALASNDMGE